MSFEHIFGMKLSALVAGLVGGLVALTHEDKMSPIKAIVFILAGGVTAGYSFTALEHWYGLHPSTTGIASFSLGLVSMRLIEILLALAIAVRQEPTLLLSLPQLFKTIKDGRNTSDNGDSGE